MPERDREWWNDLHQEIQEILIQRRDGRLSILNSPNGVVVRERDGKPSNAVRMETRELVRFIANRVDPELGDFDA